MANTAKTENDLFWENQRAEAARLSNEHFNKKAKEITAKWIASNSK